MIHAQGEAPVMRDGQAWRRGGASRPGGWRLALAWTRALGALLLGALLLGACDEGAARQGAGGAAGAAAALDGGAPPAPPPPVLPPDERLAALATAPAPWPQAQAGRRALSLYDARLLLHWVEGGPVIDLGQASALKYIQGRWRAPWLGALRVDPVKAVEDGLPELADRLIAYNEGAGASVRFPLPRDLPQDEDYVLLFKIRPKVNPRVEVRLDGQAVGTVELGQRWQEARLTIPRARLRFGGEHHLAFVFAGSYFEGSDRVAARFDYIRLVPASQAEALTNRPPPVDLAVPDARVLTTEHRALGLPAPGRLDLYLVAPEGGRVRFLIAPTPILQSATPFEVTLEVDGAAPRSVLMGEVEPARPWQPLEVDLAPHAGRAVRLSFSARPGVQGTTGYKPAIYLGEPELVIVDDAPRVAPVAGADPGFDQVVVIAVDALRADRLEAPEARARVAPTLARLMKEGTYAPVTAAGSGAIVTTVSLLSGLYPARHGVFDTTTHLRQSAVTLFERFAEAGWGVHALTTNPYLTETRGFTQGVPSERYLNLVHDAHTPARTDALIDRAIAAVAQPASAEARRLVYIQIGGLRLPHAPRDETLARFFEQAYDGPVNRAAMANATTLDGALKPWDRTYLEALYDAELREIDAEVARLVAALEASGQLDRTLLVVTGTHGEPLGEEGIVSYGTTLSPGELRVPLIARAPGALPADTIRAVRLDQVDVQPTLAALAGLPPTAGDAVQGASRLALLQSGRGDSAAPTFSARGDGHRALLLGPWLYRAAPSADILIDPALVGLSAPADQSQAHPLALRAARDMMGLFLGLGDRLTRSPDGALGRLDALTDEALQRGW